MNLEEIVPNPLPPKEKAQEIFNKFFPHAYPFASGSGYLNGELDPDSQKRHAKELATILIDECIRICWMFRLRESGDVEFWQNVKLELENVEIEKI